MATAKPIPLHKALRNLEKAYGEKLDEIKALEKENAELKQQLEEAKCPATK